MENLGFIFRLIGMSMGVVGFIFAVISMGEVDKLEKQLKASGLLENSLNSH